MLYNTTLMKVDIVIPLYNEEKILTDSIMKLVEHLKSSSFPYDYSIILADNGSRDRTPLICSDLSRKYNNVKSLKIDGKGKGLAIRTAWMKSEADVLSFMDIDLSSDLDFFRPLIDSIAIKGNDMAIGNRLGPQSQVISKKKVRKISSWFYNFFVRSLFGSRLADHQCGFKAMKRSSFEKIAPLLQERTWIFDTELIVISQWYKYKIDSIDIIWRDSSESKVTLFKDSIGMFCDLLRLKSRLRKILINK
ncbi:MAG: glycosyltransferase [Candidatus Paceibacterota bacterium]